MSPIQAILFGIVQGLTEFLPISSSAHLRILPELTGQPDPGTAFTAVIQLGTVAAVIIYFAKDLGAAIKAWAKSITGPKDSAEARLGWATFFGTIPVAIIGLALRKVIESDALRSLYIVAFSMIFLGIVMAIAEKLGAKKRQIESVSMKDGLIVGLWQCLALCPGMSRSGSTISGALFQGFDRASAARLSFLLSVPSVFLAGVFEAFSARKNITGGMLTPTIIATVVSFFVGYACIAWLLKYISKHGIGVFVGYRLCLGVLLIVLCATGVLKASTPTESPTPPAGGTQVSQQTPEQQLDSRIQAWQMAVDADAKRPVTH